MKIHFVKNIRIRKGRLLDKLSPSSIYLEFDEWNDWWSYKNQYYAVYINSKGEHFELGSCKIEDPNSEGSENPEHHFAPGTIIDNIPSELISLGQSDLYYETLASLPHETRESICLKLKDSVWAPELLLNSLSKPAVKKSILRSVSLSSVTGEWKKLLDSAPGKTYYDLRYSTHSFDLEFSVDPNSMPPTNLHAIIGRNGVGKTTLLRRITRCLVEGNPEGSDVEFHVLDSDGNNEGILAGAQYVSWSAFDKFEDISEWKFRSGIRYSQIGMDGIREATPEGVLSVPAAPGLAMESSVDMSRPDDSFLRAFSLVIHKSRGDILLESLGVLMSDPGFGRLNIMQSIERFVNDHRDDQKIQERDLSSLRNSFNTHLSDGHKVVLLTTTYIAATLAEQTLVILDEPEAHLHPPLLSSFIKCLNALLLKKNAVGIVATHSPVVLQELPRTCVWKIRRQAFGESQITGHSPEIETFGEDVSALTHEIFGLEVENSGYFSTLNELATRHQTFSEALSELDGQLGVSGRSTLRSLFRNAGNS